MKKTLLSAAFIFAAMISANAQQTISFEASEGFTIGNINGQNGWVTTGAGNNTFIENQVISNELASEGTQSLKIVNESAFPGQSNPIVGAFYNYATPVDYTSAIISADMYISDVIGNDCADYRVGTVNLTAGYFTSFIQFRYNGTILVYSNETSTTIPDLTWTPNTWMNVRIEMTSTNVSYFIDDVMVHQGATAGTMLNNIEQVRFTHDNYSAEGFAIIDNFRTNNEMASVKDNALTSLSVYPNPANDVINVSNATNAIEKVVITDMNGRVVKSVVLGVNEAQINISDLSKGVYFLQATSNGASVTEKIVKK